MTHPLPQNWQKLTVKEIAPLQRGFDLPVKDIKSGDYPVVFSNGSLKKHSEFKAKAPGVITGRSGTIGKVFFIEEDYWPHNTALWVTDFKGNDPKFIYYFYCQLNPSRFSAGSGVPTLNRNDVHSYEALLPPLPEQQRIVTILETWDKAIEKLERKIELKKNVKKGLMQQLLTGTKRLPGFSGEWDEVRLGDISVMKSGGTPKSSIKEYYGGDIPWVSIADMTSSGKYINSTMRNLTKIGIENSTARTYPKGTVLYAMYASIGECSIAGTEVSSSQAILGISTNENLLNNEYLYYYLNKKKEEIKLLGQQGAQSNLNAGIVKDFKLHLPKVDEQKVIVQVLNTADTEIDFLKKQLSLLYTQKNYLLNHLITGHIRTPETMSLPS